MADLKVYCFTRCGTCKKALKWLDERSIGYKELAIRETPPTKAELKLALKTLGNLRRLLNTSSKDYRELGLKDRLDSMNQDELFGLLRENGNLVKRPFVVRDGSAWTGFKVDEWEERLA